MTERKLKKGKPLKKLNYFTELLHVGLEVCKVSGKKFYDETSSAIITDFIPHPITGKEAVLLSNAAFMDVRGVRPTKDIPDVYYAGEAKC